MKRRLLSIVGKLMYYTGMINVLRYKNRNKVRILAYHSISDGKDSLSVSVNEFESHMKYLSEHYNVITPYQYLYSLKLPKNPVMITMDDGFKDNYTNAFPILKKYGFRATIFLILDKLNLSKDEIKTMEKSGIIFGSHTKTHPNLAALSEKELRLELKSEFNLFCYPSGIFNELVKTVTKEDYLCAFSMIEGFNTEQTNLYELKRFFVPNCNKYYFALICEGVISKLNHINTCKICGKAKKREENVCSMKCYKKFMWKIDKDV